MHKREKLRDTKGNQTIGDVTVKAGSDGQRFYDKHMRPSARISKKKDRKQKKASRRRNRK